MKLILLEPFFPVNVETNYKIDFILNGAEAEDDNFKLVFSDDEVEGYRTLTPPLLKMKCFLTTVVKKRKTFLSCLIQKIGKRLILILLGVTMIGLLNVRKAS